MSKKYFETTRDKLIYDAGKLKVSLVSVKDEGKINGKKHIGLSAKKCNPPSGESIKISGGEELLQEIDINKNHYQIWIKKESVTRFLECFLKMLKKAKWNEFENSDVLLSLLKSKKVDKKNLEELMQKPENFEPLKKFIENDLTAEDFVAIGYRKQQLKIFNEMLSGNFIESEWQKFFEKNEWIFGYGLDYRFIESSNREVGVGYGDIDFGTVESQIIFYFICHFWYKFLLFLAKYVQYVSKNSQNFSFKFGSRQF